MGNFGTNVFCIHTSTTVKKRALRDTFFGNYEPNFVPEMSRSIFK